MPILRPSPELLSQELWEQAPHPILISPSRDCDVPHSGVPDSKFPPCTLPTSCLCTNPHPHPCPLPSYCSFTY